MKEIQILIVEDDRIIVMELEDRLASLGYGLAGTTAFGEEAVVLAGERRPDLILMDIRLKGKIDGIQAAAEIRSRFDIPVIYLTAYTDQDTLQRAKIAEPYGYIVKPFAERELHSTIEMALHKHAMEARLREQEQWLAAILDSIGEALIATDATGTVTLVNPVAESLTGWALEEARGRPLGSVFRTIDPQRRLALEDPVAQTLRQGQAQTLDGHVLLSRDGAEFPIDGSTALIQDRRGQVEGTVLVFRDITERQRQAAEREELQARLFQAQQQEVVGALAGDIVHDFNNTMTAIIGYSSLLEQHHDDPDLLGKGLGSIRRAGNRATTLTQQLLAEDHRQMPPPQLTDLQALLEDLAGLMHQPLAREEISLVVAPQPAAGLVLADPAQIEQVVLNLVVNAREAMPHGGEIRVTTERLSLDAAGGHTPGDYVRLAIADMGSGITTETMAHILEPHFTTKNKGSGLGLSISRDIVRRHGGWLEVHSSPEEGTTVGVYLPAAPASLADAALRGTGQQILLVENDWSVCSAMTDMLRASGYGVSPAAQAKVAFDLLEEAEGVFDLLLTDVILPDRDGLEFAAELQAIDPGLAVLLTSGYLDDRTPWPAIQRQGYHFLAKPFGLRALLLAVRQALRSPQREVVFP